MVRSIKVLGARGTCEIRRLIDGESRTFYGFESAAAIGTGYAIAHAFGVHWAIYWAPAPWYQRARQIAGRTFATIGACTVLGSILSLVAEVLR